MHNNRHESNQNGEKMSTRSIVNLFKMYCRSCGLFRVLRTKNVSRLNKHIPHISHSSISIACLPKVVNFKSNIVQVYCMNTLMWNYTHEKNPKLTENQLSMEDIMMYKLYKLSKKQTICSLGITIFIYIFF